MASDRRSAGRRFLRTVSALVLLCSAASAYSQSGDEPPSSSADAAEASDRGEDSSESPSRPDGEASPSNSPPDARAPSEAKLAPPASSGVAIAPAPSSAAKSGRKTVPKAVDPTPAQREALAELQREGAVYEADAKDYRGAMSRIIQHHYREKKRRLLGALDREIDVETRQLRDARAEAIRRLETFVATYSGANSHPESTPDAMFRLAALYEEKARDDAESAVVDPNQAPPELELGPAIALYKRILNEFPAYQERAGVYYYLGHSLNDVGRIEEAQQVWRALVCNNRFSYPVPPDPRDPSKDSLVRMLQDHDPAWWLEWLSRHPEPMDKKRARMAATPQPADGSGEAAVVDQSAGVIGDDEDAFKNPFPADCRPIPQEVALGDQPRYVGEVWWRLGDYHFDEIDPFGGPYNLARAEAAYDHAMQYDRPPVYDVSMYKLAWTYFKQQRYEAAVREYIKLLELTDRREAETGNPGADFRAEAFAYIAGSITYLDFVGPPAGDPYIARNDVFDLYSEPAQVEEAMHPSIQRVQDAALIPQDKKWTVDVYRALAFEFKEYNQLHNLVEIYELIQSKWPNHRDAPTIQNQIALTYENLSMSASGAEAEKYASKAHDARALLVSYVEQPGRPSPEWVEKNKEDPEAIRAAEQLVRVGLKRAAADHTNAARLFVRRARDADSDADREQEFTRALREYRGAAVAWGSYLNQDENADDAYDSRFWLADANSGIVLVEVELGRIPQDEDIKRAQQSARDVRDSNDNDDKMQPAAQMVVNVAQAVVRANYKRHETSGGTEGFPNVESVATEKYEEDGERRERVVKVDIPPALRAVIESFDEYIERVPVEKEPDPSDPNHHLYAFNAGEAAFLYGQFDEAKTRLTPIYTSQCGSTKFAFQAWKKLVTIAALERDFDASKRLAEENQKKTCALTDADRTVATSLGTDILNAAIFKEAYAAFEKAQKLPVTPETDAERRKNFERAASLYEEGLKVDPGRDEAPEAAINGAISHKQLGNYDKAIAMYELFIGAYGKDDFLEALRSGDKAKNLPPEPEKYGQRVRYLKMAYDALAETYVLFFDYNKAAQTFDKISETAREVPALKEKTGEERPNSRGFDLDSRRNAAQNALFLYLNIGEAGRAEATRKRFFAMNPPREQQAEIEWLLVQSDVKAWDERAPDRGENKAARNRALSSLEGYFKRWSGEAAGYGFAVQAAGLAAKLRRAANDSRAVEWCENAIRTFESYRGVAPKDEKGRSKALGSVQSEFAAECAYRKLDDEIRRTFDYEAGFHRYQGVITKIRAEFLADVNTTAKAFADRLRDVTEKYESPRWMVAAAARRGTLFDSARTGLYNAREPELKLYSDEQQPLKLCAILKKPKCSEVEFLKELDKLCTETGNEKACDGYDSFTAKRRTDWRTERDSLLEGADRLMVGSYTEAITLSKFFRSRTKEVDLAVARLAFHQEIITDPKLSDYASAVRDPNRKDADGKPLPFEYTDGMFPRMRRGLGVPLADSVVTAPVPGAAR